MKILKIMGVVLVFLAIVVGIIWYKKDALIPIAFTPTETETSEATPIDATEEVVATGLDTPWEIAFLPDGSMLVTERSGRLLHLKQDRKAIPVAGVVEIGEGGLLGMAVHPDFVSNKKVYFYYTTKTGSTIVNKVESYRLENNTLSDSQTILASIPAANNHDGGRIAFGPDGYLYIATGDAQNEQSAQDIKSLAGKILRIKDDGSIPADNPFGNAVYSYGHRNPQGLAWDNDGVLWATEHGPSGLSTGYDELNKIEKGKNYGWPVIRGDERKEGMVTAIVQSGSNETWAPAGIAYYNGKLFFAGLRGQTLYQATIAQDKNSVTLQALLKNKYGRLRAVTAGPDGFLYVSTSNKDGRGKPVEGDDKIIKLKF